MEAEIKPEAEPLSTPVAENGNKEGASEEKQADAAMTEASKEDEATGEKEVPKEDAHKEASGQEPKEVVEDVSMEAPPPAEASPAAPKEGAVRLDDAEPVQIADESAEKAPADAEMTPKVAEVPSGPVELEDSDDDMEVSGAMAEMMLPPNLLTEEFADEAVSIDADESVKDKPPFPPFPPRNFVPPSDARKRILAKGKQKASELLADGQAEKALEKYSELIKSGGATALILAARADILLQLARPCAAIRDCCLALQMNPDCGKAHLVRGAAHQKLGHWKKSYRDLSQGQKLDFQDQYASLHDLAAKRAGATQDRPQRRLPRERVGSPEPKAAPPVVEVKPPSKEFKIGQAVRLGGLQKAPHLNGRRGLVQRLSSHDNDRWDVEVRMDRGMVEIKSIRSENVIAVQRNQAAEWQLEEARFAEERKRREKEDKRWKEEEEKSKRFNTVRTGMCEKTLNAQGFPVMDTTEKLEAEMSCLPLDHEALSLLRRLRPSEALQVLQQVSIQGINNNMSSYIKIKVRSKLGDPDNTDEDPKMPKPVPAKTTPTPTPAPQKPAAAEAEKKPEAATEAPASEKALEKPAVEEPSEEDSEDEDFDLLPEEKEPTLDAGYVEAEPTEKQMEALAKWKEEAHDSLEAGDVKTALERFTEVVDGGGGSALILAKRGELLLKERRPLAAIKDCAAALALNSDLGKAYRIRGIALRKLGRYREAKTDLDQAQKLDFDEGVSIIEKFVTEKVRLEEKRGARKRRRLQ